eukprot:TRINITY_DN2949_c0_g1_i2.p1 TRINITY_DN2949_c0_g1~~TRINITY_DN2949_c0_g1_i2.p1  ORF type:complete len:469 (+),score=65.56 TRINITY_DN2949_c0_g1_i2:139-1545(+)
MLNPFARTTTTARSHVQHPAAMLQPQQPIHSAPQSVPMMTVSPQQHPQHPQQPQHLQYGQVPAPQYDPQQQQRPGHQYQGGGVAASPYAQQGVTAPPVYGGVVQQLQGMNLNEPKIDPAVMPRSSVSGSENLIQQHNTEANQVPPPPGSRFYVVDSGNCGPRFMRMSMYNVAATADLQRDIALPLGVIIQPLAQTHPMETKVPLVDMGPVGPLRCGRCRGYINPFVTFLDNGKKYTCSLCSFANDVPDEYFCHLDGYGRRTDLISRPELSKGSIDLVASKEYIWREVQPLPILFVIDVSFVAISSGLLETCAQSIKALLESLPPEETTRVGFITYDAAVQFYYLTPSLQRPQMYVMTDVTDVFVPLEETVLVDYRSCRSVIHELLDSLVRLFPASAAASAPVVGSALEVAFHTLESTGGKVIAFISSLAQTGNGILKPRGGPKVCTPFSPEILRMDRDFIFFPVIGCS